MRLWMKFLADEGGATAVEYALLLGVIILGSVATLAGFGVGLQNIYNIIDGALPTR